MKENMKFLSLVLAVLLLSLSILTGCMFGIGADRGEEKPYDTESGVRPGLTGEDAPTPQVTLQEKFYGMYEISEDKTSITVISEEYLSEYWDFQTETVRSLTVEEVLFIIQDSIRIYETYETITLPGFASPYDEGEKADRYPCLEEQVIERDGKVDPDREQAEIHDIILYRLTALSSPKAFLTGYEVLRHIGTHSLAYSKIYPSGVFYIPGYASETDREALLKYFSTYFGADLIYPGENDALDYFDVSAWGTDTILFYSKNNKTQVFPTAETGPVRTEPPVPNIVDGQFVWNEAQFPTIKNIKIGPNTLTNPNPTEEEISNFLCQAFFYLYAFEDDYWCMPYLIPRDETRPHASDGIYTDDIYYPLDRSYIKDRQYMQSVAESFFDKSRGNFGYNTDGFFIYDFLDLEDDMLDDVWTTYGKDELPFDNGCDPSLINFVFEETYWCYTRICVYIYRQHSYRNDDGEVVRHGHVDIRKFSLTYTDEGLWKLAHYQGGVYGYGYDTTLRDDYGTRLTVEKAD